MFYGERRYHGFRRGEPRHGDACNDAERHGDHAEDEVADACHVKRILCDTFALCGKRTLHQCLR